MTRLGRPNICAEVLLLRGGTAIAQAYVSPHQLTRGALIQVGDGKPLSSLPPYRPFNGQFPIVAEKISAQFRVESFSLFNRLNLSGPETGDSPGSGAGEPRHIQLALKHSLVEACMGA